MEQIERARSHYEMRLENQISPIQFLNGFLDYLYRDSPGDWCATAFHVMNEAGEINPELADDFFQWYYSQYESDINEALKGLLFILIFNPVASR